MPRDLKHLFVVIESDLVIAHATNLSSFIRKIRSIEAINGQLKSNRTIQRYFKKNKIQVYLGDDRKIYTLQKVI